MQLPSRKIILSIFPGIDLLGRAFEEAGFCVLRGPDPLWGGNIQDFHIPPGRIDGIIGGPPCQDFSAARRSITDTGKGIKLIKEFARCVTEAKPAWWLMENVPRVPTLIITGYNTKRIDITDKECGGPTLRRRHFQFGHRQGEPWPIIDSHVTNLQPKPTATASEGKRGNQRRSWPEFCRLQGLPESFDLPGFTIQEKYRAVGNGVSMFTGRKIAGAIAEMEGNKRNEWFEMAPCGCGCGRTITTKYGRRFALTACRKRAERQRKGLKKTITYP